MSVGPGPQWAERRQLHDRALSVEEIASLASQASGDAAAGSAQAPVRRLEPVRTVTSDDLRRPGFLNPYSSGRVEIDPGKPADD